MRPTLGQCVTTREEQLSRAGNLFSWGSPGAGSGPHLAEFHLDMVVGAVAHCPLEGH